MFFFKDIFFEMVGKLQITVCEGNTGKILER